jgi:deoxyribodipyrimidine photo-lyase
LPALLLLFTFFFLHSPLPFFSFFVLRFSFLPVTSAPPFPPTRQDALARLEAFLPSAGRYGAERNYVRPGHGDVSRLSPWLQKRVIREEEVVAAVRARWSFAAVEKFVQEVHWRTYWKGWLEQRPDAWSRWHTSVPRLRDGLKGEQLANWEAARAGRTGIDGFDDWARELVATGYLHNHARMWFASLWIFTLRLPWELGAAFFHEHLLDGDAASNTLSWRWVAGLQTAGKTYLARADNIAKYTEERHMPGAHQLATEALALSEEPLPKVAAWSEPAPTTADLGRTGLWLHPEDLSTEIGELAGARVAAIHAAWPSRLADEVGWSPSVADWTRAALGDGAERAGKHFGAEVTSGEAANLGEALADWARAQRLDTVLAYRPFIGPWHAQSLAVEAALAKAGVRVEWRRRAWDKTHFPHATRGYFPFWERIRAAG